MSEENTNVTRTNYFQPEQSENALKIRLEIEETLEDIHLFLSGEQIVSNEAGELIKIKQGAPKANPQGVREIMKVIRSYVNKGTVQGNIDEAQLNRLMFDYKRGMANLLAFHCDEWLIDRNDRVDIINFIEPFIFLYISRAKDDGERTSYGSTIRDSSREVVGNSNNRFSVFKN